MRFCMLAFFAAIACGPAAGQQPYLVRDIAAGLTAAGSNPHHSIEHMGEVYFVADHPDWPSYELWKVTPAGAEIVDPFTGQGGVHEDLGGDTERGFLTSLNGRILVLSGTHRLFATDGPPATRTLLLNTVSGVIHQSDNYVWCFDGLSPTTIYRTDGTPAGTSVVRAATEVPSIFSPTEVASRGDEIFFAVRSGATDTELWISGGTPETTRRVRDIRVGEAGSRPLGLKVIGQLCVFFADDGSGHEPWVSDGTEAGTFRLADIVPGSCCTVFGYSSAVLGARWLFVHPANPRQLWGSDGTVAGTSIVMEFASGNIGGLRATDDRIYFSSGGELWSTQGQPANTQLVYAGLLSAVPFSSVGNELFFIGSTIATGGELWRSDGTTAGTSLVAEIRPGPNGSISTGRFLPTVVGDHLYFRADDGQSGAELWRSDGTPAGTQQVANVGPDARDSLPRALGDVDGRLFFVANDGATGYELWTSEGDADSTQLVLDQTPGPGPFTYNGTQTVGLNGIAYYFGGGPAAGSVHFSRSDGTPAGTFSLVEGLQSPAPLGPLNEVMLLSHRANNVSELWATDGTLAGTERISTAWPTGFCQPLGEVGFFSTLDSALWVTDGTPNGTQPLPGVTTGSQTGARLDSRMFVSATTPETGRELYATRGIPGDFEVIDIVPGSVASDPRSLTRAGERIFFSARGPGDAGRELWLTDGSASGTHRVAVIDPAGGAAPNLLTAFGENLLFTAATPDAGRELWFSDGTEAGTLRLADIAPAALNADISEIRVQCGTAYFVADDRTHGGELWKTDGTPGGTRLAANLAPAAEASGPRLLTGSGPRLYFSARTHEFGRELWAIAALPGDIDIDGRVDLADLATLLIDFGCVAGDVPCTADLDGSGATDLDDLAELLVNFGRRCP
jgi:ELWxxDGT repeat protein